MNWNIFGSKKEDGPKFDPLRDLTIANLKKGWLLDFREKTWEVVACHKYNWGGGPLTNEYEVRSGNETIFLEYEATEGESYIVSKWIPISNIQMNIKSYLMINDTPPEKLTVSDEAYTLDEEGGGLFLENGAGPEQEFLYWDYISDDEERFITVEQWGDSEFEAYQGFFAKEYEFTNILPRETS
ncbi:DUF4178 domain-containing protein [candidate division KSB1 bacterium]|nr:DUF4178 domain-containing protein [candidate division KSB1 bacterium]